MHLSRAETKALIGGGGCIFIYSRSARRISFEISCHYQWSLQLISKEIRRAEREYMNMHPPPPINALVSALHLSLFVEHTMRVENAL